MDLKEFTSPLPKPWLNIHANSLEADSITAATLAVGDLEADSVTINQRASVPNPAIGQSTLFVDLGGDLKTTNALGVTVRYMENPSDADIDAGGFNLINVGRVIPSGDSVLIGQGVVSTGFENTIIGFNSGCAAGNDVVIVGKGNTISGDGCFIFGRDNVSADESINIGNSNTGTAIRATTIGRSLTNNDADTWLLGNTGLLNMRPESSVCDLGSAAKPWKDLYLSGEVKGAGGLLLNGIQDQTYGIAPAGQRDLWQYGTGAVGPGLIYNESLDTLLTFGSAAISYSNDGGVTFAASLFDIAPAGAMVGGTDGANQFVSLSYGDSETYTSPDGINWTKGPASPAGTNFYSLNIDWVPFLNLFVAGVDVDATHTTMTSPDGVTWTVQASNARPWTIAHSGSVVVAAGDTAPFISYSANGILWNDAAGMAEEVHAIGWSEEQKIWIALGTATGNVYTSSDASVWTLIGVNAPTAVEVVYWVANNNYNHFYAPKVDSDGNYSLWSTTSPQLPFVGTHLDGAVANSPLYASAYLAPYDRFVIGGSSSPYFAYGTARPLDLKMLSDNIRVRGRPVNVGIYSTYADTTCNNTAVETNISTSASSVGSLSLQDSQPLGMVIEIKVCMSVSSAAGDNLDIRYYANAGLLFTHNLVIPALAVNLPIQICTTITVRNGNVSVCSIANQNGVLAMLVDSSIVYTRTQSNALSVTAQWGAALSTLTCGHVSVTSSFCNGA